MFLPFKQVTLSIFALLCFLPYSAHAQTEIEKQTANLKNLRIKIAIIQKNIEKDVGTKHKYIAELRDIDKSIEKYSKKIKHLNLEQKSLNRQSNKLRKKLKVLLQSMRVHKKTLSKQLLSTYKVGQQQALQIVLNQKSVDSISRMLTYATYLSKARTKKIKHLKTLSDNIKASVSTLEIQQSTIKENQVLLEKNKTAYTNTYASRKALLKAIDKKLLKNQKELSSLETDSSRLQRLVKSLNEILNDIPAPPQELLPFYKRKGKLKLPVKGKIIHHFYERKSHQSLRWKGIVLKTKRGLDVKSIYYGRIVFSDWLNGFGNIIIIDHGGGYLSLYAYNESLEKEIGEWVVAGDVIATTGQSGGRKQNALYFEIRQKGKPVNPLKWIKKTN
jgi:septal ring factor EnvC (AmiA/AmiB activator)